MTKGARVYVYGAVRRKASARHGVMLWHNAITADACRSVQRLLWQRQRP